MQIITAAIIKGGTGKSTTITALAQAAAKDGKRVLVVDLDPQANATYFLAATQTAGAYELLHGADPEGLIQHTAQGVDVIAASPDLATERTKPGSAKRLQGAILPLEGQYDLIMIDTPPSMGELTFNALQAATRLVIPLETDASSLQGFYQITDIARQIQGSNPALSSIGTIIARYDGRANINRYMLATITERGRESGAELLAAIRPGVAIREAQALQRNLYDYAPKSKPAQDYKALYEKILKEG